MTEFQTSSKIDKFLKKRYKATAIFGTDYDEFERQESGSSLFDDPNEISVSKFSKV